MRISRAAIGTTVRVGKQSCKIETATASIGSLNCGTITPPLEISKFTYSAKRSPGVRVGSPSHKSKPLHLFWNLLGDTVNITATNENFPCCNWYDCSSWETILQNRNRNGIHQVIELWNNHSPIGDIEIYIGRCQAFAWCASRFAVPQVKTATFILGSAG